MDEEFKIVEVVVSLAKRPDSVQDDKASVDYFSSLLDAVSFIFSLGKVRSGGKFAIK